MEGARPQGRVFLALKCEQEDIVMVSTFLPHPAVIFPVWAQSVKNLPAMQETWVQSGRSPGQEDPLGKEMATHSSILAWRIPWTLEPGRLQSTGSQRVGYD